MSGLQLNCEAKGIVPSQSPPVPSPTSASCPQKLVDALILPAGYKPLLTKLETEHAIKLVKETFEAQLSAELSLLRVSAPLFVLRGTGINDDLNGIEKPVSFEAPSLNMATCEIVQSLAKWKRIALKEYEMKAGQGLVTDMRAVRPSEDLDNLHSLYVDQWDWERVMNPADRNLDFLKMIVRHIYSAIRATEIAVAKKFPVLAQSLPEQITFVQTEELQQQYPNLTPLERESAAAKQYGAIFVIGIGGQLADGKIHDGRAPDYDDWSTPTGNGHHGLNGDIVVWNSVLNRAFELSSMGIRVDRDALLRQLEVRQCTERAHLYWHKRLLGGDLPQSVGGGVGQARLCMFMLKKAHIGEIQASVWPHVQVEACKKAGITLL